MDYEKKYNEALEKARMYRDNARAVKEYAAAARYENIFPQLRESEDERIRKALICGLSEGLSEHNWQGFGGATIDECLTYLEKQKEQKPISQEDFDTAKHEALWEEQKPAECLKADRDGWYVCIKDFYAGGKKQCSVGDLVQAKGGMYMMGREDISEWFRKAYYEEVRNAFAPNADTTIPEPKPAWSEEDETHLSQAIETLEHENYLILADKLKSLRPSWKPSEEQIATLGQWLKDKQFDGDSRYVYPIFESLYEQLKKLM